MDTPDFDTVAKMMTDTDVADTPEGTVRAAAVWVTLSEHADDQGQIDKTFALSQVAEMADLVLVQNGYDPATCKRVADPQ